MPSTERNDKVDKEALPRLVSNKGLQNEKRSVLSPRFGRLEDSAGRTPAEGSALRSDPRQWLGRAALFEGGAHWGPTHPILELH